MTILKTILGLIFIIGVIGQFFERIYAPDYLVADQASMPDWTRWMFFILVSVGGIGAIILEYWKRKNEDKARPQINP